MKALEVSIDGKVIGIYVPPEGASFSAMLANIPGTHMRVQVLSGNWAEDWQWQLPDIKEGQAISFRMVEAELGEGVPPQFVRKRDEQENERIKAEASAAYERARKRMNES